MLAMARKTHTAAIVVAAGRGTRAGDENGPKQYQRLGSKTVLGHAMDAFLNHGSIDLVLPIIHADDAELYTPLALQNAKFLPPSIGGATRQQSVFYGLQALAERDIDHILIHDAARPFVDAHLIDRVLAGLRENEAVLPAVAVADTLKRGEDGMVVETVPRENLYGAQTPQGFHYMPIWQAHQAAVSQSLSGFTDDSALAEWAGLAVTLVAGSPRNKKLTTSADIAEAREQMTQGLPDIRVGHGYDTHQLIDGSSIWLCGIEIPHNRSLAGHSDADVVCMH